MTLNPQVLRTPPLLETSDASVSTHPSYWMAGSRDSASTNILDATAATALVTPYEPQAHSNYNNAPLYLDSPGNNFSNQSQFLEQQRPRSLFHIYDDGDAGIHRRTPFPRQAIPVQQNAPPSTFSPELTSQLSRERLVGPRASSLISPEPDTGAPVQIQNPSPEADYDEGTYLGDKPAKTRALVERLQELVLITNKEWWMQSLLPTSPDIYARCSTLSARTLLSKGIVTLKTWFLGKFEKTFEEVLSFMQVAFAMAIILHHEDESHYWDAFFQDALWLQHALVDNEEKFRFLTVLSCWWCPEGQQSTHISLSIDVS